MKVIDLLNKIAKGEKLPKKIEIDGIRYRLAFNYKKYNINFTYEDGFGEYWLDKVELDEEVEIIEEEKEIEKAKLKLFEETGEALMHPRIEEYNEYNFKELKRVTDEIIDELNKIKKEGK